MPQPMLIVGITRTDAGFVVHDQHQAEHPAANETELGTVIAKMIAAADVPKAEVVSPTANKIHSAAVDIANRVIPQRYQGAGEPLVNVLTDIAQAVVRRSQQPKARAPSPGRRRPAPHP